ncbi:GlxA family transcriptional regulator [Streptomyces chartreusis]
MHRVAVLAYESVVALELSTALQVFGSANVHAGTARYDVGVVGAASPVGTHTHDRLGFSLAPDYPLEWAQDADTVIVPAHGYCFEPPPEGVSATLLDAQRRGARVVSLCVGAFILASTGLLDGRAATTHWNWAADLADRYPTITVHPDRLYVRDGNVWTSGGGLAALDLVLHLIEQDHGAALAATTARYLVAPMRREGGQAQFIEYSAPRRTRVLQSTLTWAEEHLADDLAVADLARHAHLSPRTFTRHFRAEVGATPWDWLLRTRIRRAQQLLEGTTWSVERIAGECGFRSEASFRYHFRRIVAVTPGRYRRTFGADPRAVAPS